jgi:hypothetical protein
MMRQNRPIVRAGAAIIGTIVGWGLIRLLFPSLDYYPPESLTRDLERSWFVTAGVRKLAMMGYGMVALVVMAMLFNIVQQRWPGRGSFKGLTFGASFGVVWSFGFLSGWAFLGTTLRAELLNGVVDLVPWVVAGWLIGLAVGRDGSSHRSKPTVPCPTGIPTSTCSSPMAGSGPTVPSSVCRCMMSRHSPKRSAVPCSSCSSSAS